MSNEVLLVGEKDVSAKNVEQSEDKHQSLNVFVHSQSGSPESWTEDEVSVLLGVWRELAEQSPMKRVDVRRVLKRLKETEGGFRNMVPNMDEVEKAKAKDDIKKQMGALRKEYQVFKGMQEIEGLAVTRHSCVDQLEHILDRIPQARRTSSYRLHNSEDSAEDHSRRRRSVSEGERISVRSSAKPPRNNQNRNQDEVFTKPRFQQRRMNLTRLVRVMVSQQQTMLEQLEKLFRVLEVSSERMARLAEVSLLLKDGGGNAGIPADDSI